MLGGKKLFVYASQFADHFADAAGFGWEAGESRFDWAKFIAAKDREVARLEAIYRKVLDAIRAGDAQRALHRMAVMLSDTRDLMQRSAMLSVGPVEAVPTVGHVVGTSG